MKLSLLMLWVMGMCCLAQDVVHLQSGDSFEGEILNLKGKWVEFNVIIDGPRGRGESRRRLPREEVSFIDFAQTEAELAIAAGERFADAETLRRLWVKHEKLLDEANSPAGAYGVLLAKYWLAEEDSEKSSAALHLLDKVIASDWDEGRRGEAQQWRLRALVANGRGTEAKKAAAALLDKTADPLLMVEARQVLGHAAFAQLRELVEAHPRWMEDDEIFPLRNTLFHEAIDHFLYGSLFQGALRQPAASGLWQVCQVYQHAEMPDKAQATAEDLLKLYPESKESERASRLLEELNFTP